MKFRAFHHPDLSLPVIRRRVTDELIDLTACFMDATTTRGRNLIWDNCFPSSTAYLAAMSEDPLLPEGLWPRGYQGRRVWDLHRRFQQVVGKRL